MPTEGKVPKLRGGWCLAKNGETIDDEPEQGIGPIDAELPENIMEGVFEQEELVAAGGPLEKKIRMLLDRCPDFVLLDCIFFDYWK
jgi:hypothetical protein